MKIIEGKEKEYQDWYDQNDGPYSRCCFDYADAWASLMESRMAQGETLEACAKLTSHQANTESISGGVYSLAVGILSKCWIHGEQLQRWSTQ